MAKAKNMNEYINSVLSFARQFEYARQKPASEFLYDLADYLKNLPTIEAVPVVHGEWIPVSQELPEDDKYILLSFENFSLPEIGRYEANENGGAFFVGDDDLSCVAYGLFVNAWMPLIEPYRENEDD